MKDSPVFISLGAACDTAMNLNYLQIRKYSLPFDWFWNLSMGMEFVNECIRTDFQHVLDEDSYATNSHYRFDEPVVTYKEYPLVHHMHSDPLHNKKDHETLNKRFNRFKEILTSNADLNFIYYRAYEEDLLAKKVSSVEESVALIFKEVTEFLRVLGSSYPKAASKSKILVILQVDALDIPKTEILLKEAHNELIAHKDSIISGCTILRNTKNEAEIDVWKSQYRKLILSFPNLPAEFEKDMDAAIKNMDQQKRIERIKSAPMRLVKNIFKVFS